MTDFFYPYSVLYIFLFPCIKLNLDGKIPETKKNDYPYVKISHHLYYVRHQEYQQ